jgi:uncharacterized protein (DUF1778 family)
MRPPFPHIETNLRPTDPDLPILSARFANANEIILIKRAAEALGMSAAAFIRMAALERANAIAMELPKMAKKPKATRPALRVIKGGKRMRPEDIVDR